MHATDTRLLKDWVTARDPEALSAIVSRHSAMVFGTCRRILGNAADAEDAAQECFMRLSQVDHAGTSLVGLLHTMATRQAMNRIRTETRRRARERAYADMQPDVVEPSWEDVQPLIDEAIGTLPDRYRIPLIRHFLEGETHAAIAADLGLSRTAVTRRIQGGIERVRDQLKGRGLPVVATALGAMLVTHGAEAAPTGLTASLGKLAISGMGQGTRAVAGQGNGWAVAMWMKAAALVVVIGGVAFWRLAPSSSTVQVPHASAPVARASVPAATVPVEASALATGADSESVDKPKRLRVVTVSAEGFVRGGVHVGTDWPSGAYTRNPSDAQGNFEVDWSDGGTGSWFAYSSTTRRAGLFNIVSEAPPEPIHVILDYHLMEISGRVTTHDGRVVPKSMVQLRITDEAGQAFVATALNADSQGHFGVRSVPTRDGCRLAARVVPPGDTPPSPWSKAYPLQDSLHHLELDDLIVSPEESELIAAAQGYESFNSCHRNALANATPKTRLSGVVIDDAGAPVANARIELSCPTKNGMSSSVVACSDATGRWSRLIPELPIRVDTRVVHGDFVPTVLQRDWPKPSLESMRAGTAEIVLRRGITLTGTVVDHDGAPVPDALLLTHTLYSRSAGGAAADSNAPIEDESTVRTGADGSFTLSCLPEGERKLHVIAPGFAPSLVPIDVEAGTGPLTIAVDIGGTIRGRIVDEEGNALPGGYIYGSSWEFGVDRYALSLHAQADEHGNFVLSQVPTTGIVALSFGVRKENNRRDRRFLSMSARDLVPREEPYDVVMYRPIRFEGTVVDAVTGAPIPQYSVYNGWINKKTGRFVANRYSRPTEVDDLQGSFSKELDRISISYPPTGRYAVRIVADGYLPVLSPEAAFGDPVEPFAIRLKPGAPWTGTVVDTRGLPVDGARVAWVDEGRLAMIQRGQLSSRNGNRPEYVGITGDDGHFEFPAAESAALIVALHETGYAVATEGAFKRGSALTLLPWATVSGTLTPVAAERGTPFILLRDSESVDVDNSRIHWVFGANPDPDNTFQFTHVPAIPMEIGLRAVTQRHLDLVLTQSVDPVPGEALDVVVGEGHRAEGQVECEADIAQDAMGIRIVAEPSHGGSVQVAFVSADGRYVFPGLAPGTYQITAHLHDTEIEWPGGLGKIVASDTQVMVIANDAPASIAAPQFLLMLPQ